MSRLTDLIARTKAKDADLGRELEREFKALSSRRAFGLNFERHRPENVELPGRPIRKGDKVRILPERGSTKKGDQRLWKVRSLAGKGAERVASLSLLYTDEPEQAEAPVADLVVVAEFRDYIYPGLVSTGKVEIGGDKPYHTVINGENFHALEALTFTHRGKVDAIYIDPPYNTGARDWKYNNDYVEGEDQYRHSKWLAMMERRLLVARELLNPSKAILIVSIDEKEFLRLGLLLEQIFPEASIQMISSVINPSGAARTSAFRRTDEYIFFVFFGTGPKELPLPVEWRITRDKRAEGLRWDGLLRSGSNTQREDRPNQFYPIFAKEVDGVAVIHSIGETYEGEDRGSVAAPEGAVAIWPIRRNGTEGNWQVGAPSARRLWEKGYLRLGKWRAAETTVSYIKRGGRAKIEEGIFPIVGRASDNSVIVDDSGYNSLFVPGTQWRIPSHSAEQGGTKLLRSFLPARSFPFPKSLYAVEDALRFFVSDLPNATILDFFSGSGTTAHAVMRLNKQDGGKRQCISVTNNEVGADEQGKLRKEGFRPGDEEWEQWGICDHITKPRIRAAITGQTPEGQPINGDYKFTDEFPMADGFQENAEFFTLTYETPVAVSHNRAFERIAPLLWMRAGSVGSRIDSLPQGGWAVADCYGLLTDLDQAAPFSEAIHGKGSIRIAYIVTDDERRFQSVVRQLPETVEPVRLYESYLTNFRFSMGR
ncbi:site-specific DNA-methyltransferase [Erythrobacter aureus]|uniref:site-specific DNA-methyltransferase (adenine-specific) n=1 Tax=Erythrobacter aureus TaxID=2182384 RepID=A0A345YAT7_9SPHN|nr:DNA methyltransferase [Erythrobacter aureus]AXK41039.1 site-specific DNA-methyltransferase [Erythrobacter aureus]